MRRSPVSAFVVLALVLCVLALATNVAAQQAACVYAGSLAQTANRRLCDRTTKCSAYTYPNDYCPNANTRWRDTCLVANLPNGLLDAVTALLPEGRHPDPAIIRSDIYVYFTAGSNNNMSVTYLQSNAGNTNRMGYAFYSGGAVSNPVFAIQRSKTNGGTGCITPGDTWKFGPFLQDDMLIFFLDSNSNSDNRFWSYFGPGVVNSGDLNVCGSPGCVHSAWAFLTDYDTTVFGFEDQSLGDADYNDLVFYLTLEGNGFYNEVPPYSGGTLLICNNNTIVSWNSYADLSCQPWGLLETSTSSSCLTYLSIPAGWTWAPDDADSKAAIGLLYAQWGYTEATCFLLADSKTAGTGYTVVGGVVQECTQQPPVKYITPAGVVPDVSSVTPNTKLCYNTVCTARYVLKSLSQSVACSAVSRCGSGILNTALLVTPTAASEGVVTYPDSVTAYLATGTGSMSAASAIQLTGTDLTNPKVDIVVLGDYFVSTNNNNQQQNSITSSWSSVIGSFRSLNLNARFASVAFRPSDASSTASYSLTSDYTLAAVPVSLTGFQSQYGCGSSDNARLRRSRNLVSAFNDIANSNQFNWASDSYRIVWIQTSCTLPVDGASTNSAITLRSIQQTTGIVPIIAYAQTSGSFSFNSGVAPWKYGLYYSGSAQTWDQPFRTTGSGTIRGAALVAQFLTTFQVVASAGDTNWLANIPGSETTLDGSGFAQLTYNIRWPTSVPANTVVQYYRTSVQIIGRDTVSFLIYFNHAPSIADNPVQMTVLDSTKSFTMSVSDPDAGNILNLIVNTLPTQGSIALSTTPNTPITAPNTALAQNQFTLIYTPYSRANPISESFLISVSDGCATAQARVTITAPSVNRPPVAKNITINMQEDMAATGTNGVYTFTTGSTGSDLYDPDGNTVTAFLSASAFVASGTVRLGTVTQQSSTSPTYVARAALPSTFRYRLNFVSGFTGYGQILLPYVANDGTLDSATAYIIINVAHVNHLPTLTAPAFVYGQLAGPAVTFTAYATDADYAYAGEALTLRVTSSGADNWGTGTGAYSITKDGRTWNGVQSKPFVFSNAVSSPSTNSFTFASITWTPPSTSPAIVNQTFSLQVRDTAGGVSNTVPVTFVILANNPPYWIQWPTNLAAQPQGATWDQLYFSATDPDGVQVPNLEFRMTTAPQHGSIWLVSTGGATATIPSVFSTTTASVTNQVKVNSTWADFRVRYTGDSSYVGTDYAEFSVTDPTGLSGGVVRVTWTSTRIPTRPTSSNIVIRGYENTLTTFPISGLSTNDPSLPVSLVLTSINFHGQLSVAGTPWGLTEFTTTGTNGASLGGSFLGDFGWFSNPTSSPVGSFTFQAYEPENDLYSAVNYTATIYLEHVNHPPTSSNVNDIIKKRDILVRRLPAQDPDAGDGDSTLSAVITSVTYYGSALMYFDEARTLPITSETLNSRGLDDRTFYYVSEFEYNPTSPMVEYSFQVADQAGLRSTTTYRGTITVLAAGDSPVPGVLDVWTAQETPVPMNLANDVTTESGEGATVTITSLPTKGTFSYCTAAGICSNAITSGMLPFLLPSSAGRVVYLPRDYDWGDNFTSFNFMLTDIGTGANGTYTMRIHVTHVNKRPFIASANFLSAAQSTAGVTLNESQTRVLDWYTWDVDDLPANQTTKVTMDFWSVYGFSIYSCDFVAGDWNSLNCTFNQATDVPEAVRSDFAKGAAQLFNSYEVMTSDCETFDDLKLRYGVPSRDCEAHFRMVFAPVANAYATPYVTITWYAVDAAGAESAPIQVIVNVKAVNSPPTIWAPAQVVGASGVNNPFIRDTNQNLPTFNRPVTVGDIDATSSSIEQLTVTILPGSSGNFTWPATANCVASTTQDQTWVCLDRIAGFNNWLEDVRITVLAGDRANVLWTINDLGNTGDYVPSPHLTANATTTVIISAGIAAPTGSSSTLAIAVGVAAAAGLLLLGALGFFLRKAVSAPTDDYFAAATAPISAAPQSPLYQAQNTEHMSPLYKGNA